MADTVTAAVQQAFLTACRLDVAVRKPGNVSLASSGHGMQALQFVASAQAAAPALCQAHARVGARIEAAVQASWAAAGCNTNLGILLLCAPLAAAAQQLAADGPVTAVLLRQAVQQVLAGLDRDDAAAAFRAIALANPGGLGRADAHDVHAPPQVGLREAMAHAAPRDSIARQYRDGLADLFDTGLAALAGVPVQLADQGPPAPALTAAVQRVFLGFVAAWPDSHIVRKHGEALAHSVMSAAQPWQARAAAGQGLDDDAQWGAWDESLKQQGLNPGTSADLTVATLMLAALLQNHGTDRDYSGTGAAPAARASHTQNPIQEIAHHGKD